MELIQILGRILFGGYFVYNGVNHFLHFKTMVEYTQSKKVPMASIAVALTGIMLLLGGLSFIIGYPLYAGSSILIVFLVPVTFMMHGFWAIEDPQKKSEELMGFMKNLALLGALIIFITYEYVSKTAV